MIIFESPSRIIEDRSISWAKIKALTAAKASMAATKLGRPTFSTIEAITYPLSSQITTPIPTVFSSLITTPSKLILRNELGGGFHLTLWGTRVIEFGGFAELI